jgi:hypothetical protein
MLLSVAIGQSQTNEIRDNAPENAHKVAPLVIMEKTDLTGRIVFIQEDEKDEEPGSKLRIAILTENKRKKIYETKTDDQGVYQIPQLESGSYWMEVGQLRLRLHVKTENEQTPESTDIAPVPGKAFGKSKVLVIFIPRDLA